MNTQQEAKDAATALGEAWAIYYRPGMGRRQVEAFKAAWKARGEADRAAVDGLTGTTEYNRAIDHAFSAIDRLDDEQ